MKTYRNYIFESAVLPDFQKDYENICGKLYAFWGTLDDVLEDIVDINNRNVQEVADYNAHLKQPKTATRRLNMPKKGERYNYITKAGGNPVMVEIVEPNAQDKDKTALPNTSIVKTITPPITQHTAEWSKLSVVKKQLTS